MNILPKKRWHVRTKDNIARVRRDEAQAALEEQEKSRRAKLAEQEARTSLLRQRARGEPEAADEGVPSLCTEKPDEDVKQSLDAFSKVVGAATAADIYTEAGNINFFKDLETGKGTTNALTNKEHEADEKEEKEKYEKSIGLLTYLGQDSLEATKSKEWYHDGDKCVSSLWSKPVVSGVNVIELAASSTESEQNTGKALKVASLKYVNREDPLNDIIKYAGWKSSKSSPVGALNHSASIPSLVSAPSSSLINSETVLAISDGKSDRKLKRLLVKQRKLAKKISDHTDRMQNKSRTKKRKREKSKSRKKKHSKEGSCRKAAKQKRSNRDSSENSEDSSSCTDSEKKQHKRRKIESRMTLQGSPHMKRTSQKHSSASGSSSSDASCNSESETERQEREKRLQQLRAERLAREAVERRRAQRLLAGKSPDEDPSVIGEKVGQQNQKYNSQFNPLLARQNRGNNVLKSGVKYF